MDENNEPNERTYVARPVTRVSRKKYGHAIRLLKAAMETEKLSWTRRLRDCELLLLIYGIPMPELVTRRDRRSVKRLIVEDAFEREMRTGVREGVMSQTAREAKQAAEESLAKQASEAAEAERQEQDVWAEVMRRSVNAGENASGN